MKEKKDNPVEKKHSQPVKKISLNLEVRSHWTKKEIDAVLQCIEASKIGKRIIWKDVKRCLRKNGIKKRSMTAYRRKFMRISHENKYGKWTEEEIKALMKTVKANTDRNGYIAWENVMEVMREIKEIDQEACMEKYRSEISISKEWNEEEIKALKDSVKKHQNLAGAISWKKVTKDISKIKEVGPRTCKNKYEYLQRNNPSLLED